MIYGYTHILTHLRYCGQFCVIQHTGPMRGHHGTVLADSDLQLDKLDGPLGRGPPLASYKCISIL